MKKAGSVLLSFLLMAVLLLPACRLSETPRHTVKIAVPDSSFIQQIDENYYKLWLEERSGLDIEFVFISSEQTEEYLRLLFSSGNSDLDAVFFSPELRLSDEAIHRYGMQGYLLPLDDFIDSGETNAKALFQGFHDYDLRSAMAADDGHLYYLPSLNTAQLTQNTQVLWVNMGWLKRLDAALPQTTADLETLLAASKAGSQLPDSSSGIFFAGCPDPWSKQACNFIINAFVYNDPANSRLAVNDGQVFFAAATEEYQQAMIYLNRLYRDGLLPPQSFTFTEHQLTQLVCDPRDVIAVFSSASISDVIYRDSTEVISAYIHALPLQGPQGAQHTVPSTPLPQPGGVITASCAEPQAVFALMDLMISEEASLIACYGEPEVDWDFAAPGELSITGGAAYLNVKTRLSNIVQNKHLAGLGPIIVRKEYADTVSWSGLEADNEYIDSRAAAAYLPYEPTEYIPVIYFTGPDAEEQRIIRSDLDSYTEEMLEAFVSGAKDPENDSDWQQYTDHLEQLQLSRYLEAVQAFYEGLLEWREIH